MRRTFSILTSILIGAFVVGGLMFLFLKKANEDRARLAEAVARETAKAQEAKSTTQKLIEETNTKLAAANREISHAQQAIKALQEERALLRYAIALEPPNTRAMKGWKEAVNASLGVSCKFPPGSVIEQNDAQALTFRASNSAQAIAADARWFSLTSYEAHAESELLANFATSTPVSYVSHGYLWIGASGVRASDRSDLLVLQMRKEGRAIFLLWARLPPGGNLKTVLSMLATLFVAS